MLEIRPNCECCDRDLAPNDSDVFICSFECTWCAGCVDRFEGRRCPNCGGVLTQRPPRAIDKLAANPASTTRVVTPGCVEAHA